MKLASVTCLVLLALLSVSSAQAVPISGAYVGTFINPVPTVPPAVVTGLGTDSVAWGVPCDGVTNCLTSPGGVTPPSRFTFNSLPFTTELNTPFILGTIEFFNGTVFPGTQLNEITLFLDGFQITPTQFARSDSREITIVNTPNTGDPIASADRATIPQAIFPAANEFGVTESQSATATLFGAFVEEDAGFLNLSILGFGGVTSGSGFVIGFATDPLEVAEPSSIWLALGALLAFHLGLRRRLQ